MYGPYLSIRPISIHAPREGSDVLLFSVYGDTI